MNKSVYVTDLADSNRIVQGLQHPAMVTENDFLIPAWPDPLLRVDVVKARFVLDFTTPCLLQPADILTIGRVLRLAGRQLLDVNDAVAVQQWKALFQPGLSDDPVARRKFQKPAPAFVVKMPVMHKQSLAAGSQLDLEVLFLGTGIPLINEFLRSLIHLGHLGLVSGEGRFEVTEAYSRDANGLERRAWSQHEPLERLSCSVLPLAWLFQEEQLKGSVTLKFTTPTRLMVDGKPLRKPLFSHVFPFMLRRATSMLFAHGGVELFDDSSQLFERVGEVKVVESTLLWHDWRALPGRQGLVVGGFVGEMVVEGQALEDVYWVLAVASLFGIGKGATYGAGGFILSS